jgi:hypothetical protein
LKSFFFDTMSDFAKFIPPKRARIKTFNKLAMGALECKLPMVTNTLVEFELLMELKIEQKRVLHWIPRVKWMRQA